MKNDVAWDEGERGEGTGGLPVSERLSHCHVVVVVIVVALPLLLSSIQPKMHGPRTHTRMHLTWSLPTYTKAEKGREEEDKYTVNNLVLSINIYIRT